MDILELQNKIDYHFKNPDLLDLALTHSSYVKEHGLDKNKCNERLEFIGDGFLDAIIGSCLYKKLPDEDEGRLTKMRASIVCEKSLARVGRELNLGEYIRFGSNEETQGGRNKDSIIADCVEAIIGAMYYDGGYNITEEKVLKLLENVIKDGLECKLGFDYKSALQEKLQEGGRALNIRYEVVSESGPDHDKEFVMKLIIGDKEISQGKGKKKKDAEQNAAKKALEEGDI